ncbi:MAG: 5-formyltetrahydrofolate cyclo-ligase [Myxococcales bacterium]|nr:5-formyltetrahydrofolate cyclo-ligase [Myxococcales bacterium]MDH3482858.1 5-formyltetrahydrofolate cyclo-ligase [Myxococcales bacterium]
MSRRRTDTSEEQIRHQVKAELRKRMRSVRGALPVSACETRSAEIAKRVVGLEGFESAKTILAFSSIRCEVRTQAIMQAAWTAGKQVALPRVVENDLHLHRIGVDTELVEGAFGVPEPPEEAPRISTETVDFAIVPALAVDLRGYRIGYGGGYYDRLLPLLKNAQSCALAFDFQLIAEVPELPIDIPVDIVVTDQRVFEAT